MKFFKKLKAKRREILEKKELELDFKREFPSKFPIALSQNEQNYLINALKNTKNYLEFGAGGSSFLALIHSKARITSIEGDKDWIEYLKNWDAIKRINLIYCDIGEVGAWCVPKDEKRKDSWHIYSSGIFDGLLTDFNIDSLNANRGGARARI